MSRLRSIQHDRARLVDEEARLVRLLRSYSARPLTWREIGDVLGITAQSAHARFRTVEGVA
jgi:hypothetical protein